MINLLGTHKRNAVVENSGKAVSESNGHLHSYGKLHSKIGRKMAHFTLLGDDLEETYRRAKEVTGVIEI